MKKEKADKATCKHPTLKHCDCCDHIKCAACGKTWGKNEQVYVDRWHYGYPWTNIPTQPYPTITWGSTGNLAVGIGGGSYSGGATQ